MPDDKPFVDTLQGPKQVKQSSAENVPPVMRKRMKKILAFVLGIPYLIFIVWCLFLLSVFPNRTGAYQDLLMPGVISCGVVIIFILVIAAIALKRILRKGVNNRNRIFGTLRLIAFILPGLILALIVPPSITKEPSLGIDIIDPSGGEKFIAPLSIKFSVQSSLEILARKGLGAVEYSWDFDGDDNENVRTAVPEATGLYDRTGSYIVKVTIFLSNGETRLIARRISIPEEVFSVSPERPGAEEPIRFSVEYLVDSVDMIREVLWDFDSDGITDLTTNLPDAVHSYLRPGKVRVSAIVKLTNQNQNNYERVIEIFEPQPPPFPVEIKSEPENLIGPKPFGAIFRVETDEEIEDVIWDFGDKTDKAKGVRVAHTYHNLGVYQATARIHTLDGEIANISTIVRVVGRLDLPDLNFDSTPEINRDTLEGEVPVNVHIIPRTSVPLIDFRWEAPGATSVGSTEYELKAIYRRAGKYDISIIGQDPDEKVMRKTLKLNVKPPSSQVVIHMNPGGGVAPQMVRFDASETVIPGEEISGFEWKFGDETGSPRQLGALVEHVFERPGTFNVELKAFTTSGNTYSGEKTIVIRAALLEACAKASRTEGKTPLGISFNMECTSGVPTEVNWDFGDGSQSDQRNPIHVYEVPGVYNAVLTIIDASESTDTETITITAQ
ncbi:PKD domain-containing protein [Patescibacteria group bacterium]|nr:PKD domain-containing protein [Patescibacteria group bacterium]MBU1124043.1 PKD domain-containing protein [Patescibacteria group bacterium]MBU1911254.1 PKD domain-containing protein [Patescibacteria group bacterium]